MEFVDRIIRINITKKYHFPFLVKIDQFSLKYDCDCMNSVIDIQIIHLQERKKTEERVQGYTIPIDKQNK